MKASVKIMRSYDYCHFEVCLAHEGIDDDLSLVNEMRKDAARLVDKAVHQYRVAKREVEHMVYGGERSRLEKEARIIRENYPKSEWTPEQKATVKALDDFEYYDYQDEWENQGY